jgi:hypothetical protein
MGGSFLCAGARVAKDSKVAQRQIFNHKGHEGTQGSPGSEVEQLVLTIIIFNFQFFVAIGIPRETQITEKS